MSLLVDAALFGVGILVVVVSAEQLVEATIGLSGRLGVSAFLVGVVAIGFDAENLAVGVAASYEATAGIALGSVVGAAMVAIALAFGLTAVLVPLEFGRVPVRILALPVGALALLTGLALDGQLSRPDVSFGNVVGSALAFFGFNAGAIALVRPVPVGPATQSFYLPVCGAALLLIVALMAMRRVPRWGGVGLLVLYAVFVGAPFL